MCVCAHACKDVCVQRGICFIVVSVLSSLWQEWGVLLRTPWEELWWASVSNAHVDACL